MSDEGLSLSIRLRHTSMSPAVISAEMGVEPNAAHAVGDQRRTPLGRELEGKYPETYWVVRMADRGGVDVGAAVASANDWLNERSAFVAGFVGSGGTVEYYITVSCGERLASEIPRAVIAQCARFEASIAFEVFCNTPSPGPT